MQGRICVQALSRGRYSTPASRLQPLIQLRHCTTRTGDWEAYLSRGNVGVPAISIEGHRGQLSLRWNDGHTSEFSARWLKDHCPGEVNPITRQRQVDTYSIPDELRIKHAEVTEATKMVDHQDMGQQEVRVVWEGAQGGEQDAPGHVILEGCGESVYPLQWLREHCTSSTARSLRSDYESLGAASPRYTWGSNVFTRPDAPVVQYEDIMSLHPENGVTSPSPSAAMAEAIRHLRVFGVLLVKGTPPTEAGAEAFAKRLGFVRHTLYGGMWATTAEGGEEEHRDTAYTNVGLPSHTDCTYLIDPPGLQIFCCVAAATVGGESTYVDGLAVGERLRTENPEAFEYFTRTLLQYQCFDNGCHYQAEGPVFQLGRQGHIMQVRHNDSDRAPMDHLSNLESEEFYAHHKSLTAIIRDPGMVAHLLLQPGDMAVCDNQRVMHGRTPFEGRRRMVGCYVGRDELESAARVHGV
ncbi:unnamed protein product [Choristocarpus tenellus]